MIAKVYKLSELPKGLSIKVHSDSIFTHCSPDSAASYMPLVPEKKPEHPSVQITFFLSLFRTGGNSICSIHKKSFHNLLDTGWNCYYLR